MWECSPEIISVVAYPVLAADEMNRKMLIGELARHGKASWTESDSAYYAIEKLTRCYNQGFHNHGKWKGIMDCHPRKLSDFDLLPHDSVPTPLVSDRNPVYVWNATNAQGKFVPVELGYQNQAALIQKKQTVSFPFDSLATDSVKIEFHLLPVHPVNGRTLRFAISLDNGQEKIVDYQTYGRSEEWKQNVIRNFALRTLRMAIVPQTSHVLHFQALDEGIVLDQVFVFSVR